jgi:hypothetical protein
MKWVGHVAYVGKKIFVRKYERRRQYGRIILKWVLRKWVLKVSTGFICFRKQLVMKSCEKKKDSFGCIKRKKYLYN